MDSKSIYLSN